MILRLLRAAPLLLLGPLATHGFACNAAPPSAPGDALRLRFPEQAAAVLDGGDTLVVTEEGFSADRQDGLRVVLPRDGARPIVLQLPGGFEARVHERSLSGPAVAEGRTAVSYAHPGGRSFWAAQAAGPEEWLLLEAGVATTGRVAATWDVEGAGVRQAGEAVEVFDGAGATRLRVTAPAAFTAAGQRVKARIWGRARSIELTVDAGGEPVLVDPVWAPAHAMITARESHTATRLASGKVLVAGGLSAGAATANVEIYDPAADTWTAAAPLQHARTNHTATALSAGPVLVTGGSAGGVALGSAEVYDPGTNTWTPAGAMLTAREHHTASLLNGGSVLIAGGSDAFSLKKAEIYNPGTNMFTATMAMGTGRSFHTATVLGDGTVLAAGGYSGGPSAEIYDPAASAWTATPPMIAARTSHSATLLGDGTVLVAGGFGNLASAEVYDPVAKTWKAVAPMGTGRSFHAAAALVGGKVLVTGGAGPASLASVELYDPAGQAWTAASPLAAARSAHTATLLASGSLLAAGGDTGGTAIASAELYTALAQGTACTTGGDCASGFCVDAFCCDKACGGAGTCNVCSKAAGATQNGTCTALDGVPCDDGDKCTQTDTCKTGTCTGGNPMVCPTPDNCHDAGKCNPTSGQCSMPTAKKDGAACDPMTMCTQNAVCTAGVCGGTAVKCTAKDECHTVGTCDAASGTCSNPEKADGTDCSTGTCVKGACTAPGTGSSSSSSGGTGGGTTTGTHTGTGGGGTSGGCHCSTGGEPRTAALWIGLGALLLARRRRAASRASPGSK